MVDSPSVTRSTLTGYWGRLERLAVNADGAKPVHLHGDGLVKVYAALTMDQRRQITLTLATLLQASAE